VSNEVETPKTFMVPAQDAALLRPILDERKKGAQQEGVRGGNLLYGLTQKKGRAADEALVVLMCFYMGESREETDAVIARGKRMLPLLKKYQDKNPKIPSRTYPDSKGRAVCETSSLWLPNQRASRVSSNRCRSA
jgi:hypothetical protein